jgi:histidinol-phosphate aminotransferase
MLSFIRSDLAQLSAYTPHPGSATDETPVVPRDRDRVDTNESPYDLPAVLKEKLAWIYQQQIETNRYPDGSQAQLKQAIAEYVCEGANLEGQAFSADHISLGNGSDELIRSVLIATCLAGEGSILVANPTFSMYGILADTLGIPVVEVGRREANFEIDIAAATEAIAATQNPPVRVVFVVHPNSPTANPLTEAELDWIRSLPPDILVAIDEAYFEFSQTSVVDLLPQHPNWVILRTFSKAFRLAALRVGYAIAHPELIAALEKIRLPYNLPAFSQAAATLAMSHRQELLAIIPQILASRDDLFAAIGQLPELQLWPSAANFIYLRLKNTPPESMNEALARIVGQMKAEGTLIRHTGGGLRVSVGTPEENQRTVQRLKGAIASLA